MLAHYDLFLNHERNMGTFLYQNRFLHKQPSEIFVRKTWWILLDIASVLQWTSSGLLDMLAEVDVSRTG